MLPETPEQAFEDVIDLEGSEENLWKWGFAIFDDERLRAWNALVLEYRSAHFPDILV